MTRFGLVLLFFVGAAGSLLSTPLLVRADAVSDIRAQIEANNRQVEALQAEIKRYQQELNAIGQKKDTLQSTINSLALSQKKLASEIQITQNKIASANLKIRELTLSIGDKEEVIAANQHAIGKALRNVAQDDGQGFFIQIISSRSISDAWQTVDEVGQFNRALADDIAELRMVRTELSVNRDEVTDVKNDLVKLNNELSLQKKSVDLQKVAQQKLLTDTRNQETTYQKIIAEKKAEEAAFEATLFALESELQYVLDPSSIPPAGKGVLRWPLDNVFVTQQFGKTSSSQRLYTSGTHNGVDFRASIGTPVRSALSGTVLAVNYGVAQNCQYGKWVLVKHPNGLATLYAHLSDIRVQNGATVSTGQVIGFSGNTGYATGPHLHFGVYISEALSFKQYKCWNGAVVNVPIAPVNAYLDPLEYL